MTDIDKIMALTERFAQHVLPCPATGCWLWTATVGTHGYGQIWVDGVRKRAHRVSWEINVGPIPNGLHVLHLCDVRSCVAPHHLFLGTNYENTRDKVNKGRNLTGSKCPWSKITEMDVLEIRASNETQAAIARRFSVSQKQIWDIQHGIRWGHVGGVRKERPSTPRAPVEFKKLTDEEKRLAAELMRSGTSTRQCAERFGIAASTAWRILHGL